jgi:hypothetical protein
MTTAQSTPHKIQEAIDRRDAVLASHADLAESFDSATDSGWWPRDAKDAGRLAPIWQAYEDCDQEIAAIHADLLASPAIAKLADTPDLTVRSAVITWRCYTPEAILAEQARLAADAAAKRAEAHRQRQAEAYDTAFSRLQRSGELKHVAGICTTTYEDTTSEWGLYEDPAPNEKRWSATEGGYTVFYSRVYTTTWATPAHEARHLAKDLTLIDEIKAALPAPVRRLMLLQELSYSAQTEVTQKISALNQEITDLRPSTGTRGMSPRQRRSVRRYEQAIACYQAGITAIQAVQIPLSPLYDEVREYQAQGIADAQASIDALQPDLAVARRWEPITIDSQTPTDTIHKAIASGWYWRSEVAEMQAIIDRRSIPQQITSVLSPDDTDDPQTTIWRSLPTPPPSPDDTDYTDLVDLTSMPTNGIDLSGLI